jgi:hypothetical protein
MGTPFEKLALIVRAIACGVIAACFLMSGVASAQSTPTPGCTDDTWTATSTTNAPAAPDSHTAVWTGTEMIVWGRDANSGVNTGGRYNPVTDSWTAISMTNAPTARYGHTAVWTGSEMIVWGGNEGPGYSNIGGRYNPTYTTSGYPNVWTQFTLTLSGLGSPTTGRLAFRYFVENGGPSGANSDYIGIDTAQYACPTPTPTPVNISGTISYCSNPVPGPVPNVTLTLSGSGSGSTLSDSSGNYMFSSLAGGGSYTVTPTKTARAPGSAGINTVDVVAVQQHFLGITFLSGCRLAAADVNGDNAVNTVDVIAIQRFFLGLSTGIANVGKYQFTPANRTYPGIVSDQTAQNYDTLVFGDVASHFVESLDSSSH